MEGKRGTERSILLVLTIILLLSAVSLAAATDCPSTDMILCGPTASDCYSPGTNNPSVNCIVSQDQIVDVKKSDITQPASWIFKSFTVNPDIKINFINSLAPPAAGGAWAPGMEGGHPGGQGVEDAGSGGDGASGADKGIGRHGGGGGAGGAGGQKLYKGGPGGGGIGGSGGGGAGGDSVYQDYAGAYVNITVETFEMKDNSVIDLSGQDGKLGGNGEDGTYSGGGAGGGPGGSGGGVILIHVTADEGFKEAGTGAKFIVNGGNGGHAGSGGEDKNGGDGGGGGGGGGGGNPGGIHIYAISYPTTMPDVDPGNGGALGIHDCSREGSGSDYCGEDGEKSEAPSAQLVKAKETAPNGEEFPIAPIISNCNDGIDNDNDDLVDMSDPDCRDAMLPWDATVWEDFHPYFDVSTGKYNPDWYNSSAANADDLACGDDVPAGHCVLNTNPEQACSSLQTENDCKAKEFCSPTYEEQSTYGKCVPSDCAAIVNAATCDTLGPEYSEKTLIMDSCTCKTGQDTETVSFASVRVCRRFTSCTLNNMYTFCVHPSSDECRLDENCKWVPDAAGQADLGAITANNNYLCTDSYDDVAGAFSTPGNKYSWVSPDGTVMKSTAGGSVVAMIENPYWIVQAEDTHFISNGDSWFYCNAAAGTPPYGSQGIPDGETFTPASLNSERACADTLANIPNEGQKIIDCDTTKYPNLADCNTLCDGTPDCQGWCRETDNVPRSYDPLKGEFLTKCSGGGFSCRMKQDDGTTPTQYISLEEYMQGEGIIALFCSRPENVHEPQCTGVSVGPSVFNVGQTMGQDLCLQYPELCVGTSASPTSTCQAIHEAYGFDYPGDALKLCDKTTQYCKEGVLVYSSDSVDGKYCCLGQNAHCAAYGPTECAALGGVLKSTVSGCVNAPCVCSGVAVGYGADECCVNGLWLDPASIALNPQNAYICYAQDGRSHIEECCGDTSCNNVKNGLNDLNLPSRSVYAMKGVPIHSLMSFDTADSGGTLQRLVRTQPGLSTGEGVTFTNGDYLYSSISYSLDWSAFSYLEFDVMTNQDALEYVILNDSGGNSCFYSFTDSVAIKKAPKRWQHITVDLAAPVNNPPVGGENCGLFNWKDVRSVEARVGNANNDGTWMPTTGVNVALDNFFLRAGAGSANTENAFCSGDWGKWLENLDGPGAGETGFIGVSSPPITDVGPYKEACNGVISFGWTGSVCCGDDTRVGLLGEYWKDSEGACWKGTAVMEDHTVADARGNDDPLYADFSDEKIKDELALLYYDGKFISCNRPVSNYEKYAVSYDGVQGVAGETMDKQVSEVADPYTIRGSWFCELNDEGSSEWVKLSKVNRVKPLAATLRKIGAVEGNGKYTLMCGDYKGLSNYLPFDETSPLYTMTGNICILKAGDNRLGDPGSVFGSYPDFSGSGFAVIGLEIANLTIPFDAYKGDANAEGVLDSFVLLGAEDFDCSNAAPDVTPDEFFTRCIDNNNLNNLYMYYNKPLNMILISGDRDLVEVNGVGVSTGEGFVRFIAQFWLDLKRFFKDLFSGTGPQNKLKLSQYEMRFTKDLYLSVQKDEASHHDRMIVGALERAGGITTLRVDYANLSTSVLLLRDAVEANFGNQGVTAVYYADASTQTIFVRTPPDANVDWRLLTSILRVNPEGTPLDIYPPVTVPAPGNQ
jgi:hypothetical protein